MSSVRTGRSGPILYPGKEDSSHHRLVGWLRESVSLSGARAAMGELDAERLCASGLH